MAQAPLKRCPAPGCRAMVRGGRCEKHQARPSEAGQVKDQWCSNKRWRKMRDQFVMEHPLCYDCFKTGRTTAAMEVHHVESRQDAPDRAYDVDNLMALCKSCHSKRTNQERLVQ